MVIKCGKGKIEEIISERENHRENRLIQIFRMVKQYKKTTSPD